jgi:hypothetical protein
VVTWRTCYRTASASRDRRKGATIMWTVVLRDGTHNHVTASTQVDKKKYPSREEAIACAMVQLGLTTDPPEHAWWEVYG